MTEAFAWTDEAVRDALGLPFDEAVESQTALLPYTGISTDSRSIEPGNLFVAIPGPNFDGHDYLEVAASGGALGAVVSRTVAPAPDLVMYRVEDTWDALGGLARYRRRALPARVIGITGSSGKTTVKNLVAAALAGSLRVHATRKNFNNRIGVPQTLLSAPDDAEVIVLEMGTSEPGEIATLTAVSEPDAAVVTTVTEAHLEGLKSLQGVLDEKLDLLRGTRPSGLMVVGDDPEALPRAARAIRPEVRVAGLSSDADAAYRAEIEGPPDDRGRYRFRMWDREILSPVPGRHGVRNVALALTIAEGMGVDLDAAIERIADVRVESLRGEVRRVGGLSLILDCYNANPQSVAAALDLLADWPGEAPRVAFLASMLELGDRSAVLHREILDRVHRLPLDLVVATGAFAEAAERPDDALPARAPGGPPVPPVILSAPSVEEGYEALRPHLRGSEVVLLKGSRGMALETLIDRFEKDFGDSAAQGAPGGNAAGAAKGPSGAGEG